MPPRPPLRLPRTAARWWRAADWLLAGVLAVPTAGVLLNEADGIGVLLAVPVELALVAGPVGWRRRWPLAAVAAQLAGLGLVGVVEPRASSVALLALAAGLHASATLLRPPVAAAVLLTCLGAAAAPALTDHRHLAPTVLFGVLYLLTWCLGAWTGAQRRHVEAVVAEQAEAARAARERARAVVAEERLVIARELHDVVTHGLSVITVQAAYGRLAAPTQPDQARDSLAAIEVAGRQALDEMRQLLGLLRRDGDGPGVEPRAGDRSPAPGVDDLDQLVARAADAGLRLDVERRGPERPLPPGVSTSVFRVVQEAVTNVVRHAGVTAASVLLDFTPDDVTVRVSDAGRGGRLAQVDAAPGYGLVGMRERVQLYGGSLRAGPVPGAGFRVSARFPVPSARADLTSTDAAP